MEGIGLITPLIVTVCPGLTSTYPSIGCCGLCSLLRTTKTRCSSLGPTQNAWSPGTRRTWTVSSCTGLYNQRRGIRLIDNSKRIGHWFPNSLSIGTHRRAVFDTANGWGLLVNHSCLIAAYEGKDEPNQSAKNDGDQHPQPPRPSSPLRSTGIRVIPAPPFS